MSFSTRSFLACLAALVQPSIAGYTLQDNYSPSNFFNEFSFFTGPDPTNGFVEYVEQGTAQSSGLISESGDSVYMGVDTSNVTPNGRPSVRITSNKAYNHGLIILDLDHMPVGCGTWPAFWMVGPDWPSHGEIDIIEGVNMQTSNAMTLHTGPGCSISNNGLFSGIINTPNCDVNDPAQPNNAGCSIDSQYTTTYGAGLNNGQGGVYATDWTSDGIAVYYFPRSKVPADITSGNPDPAGWGKPDAYFQGNCNMDNSVQNQQIVFDTTFCGDWAGGAWGSDSQCSAKAWSCEDYVANNPSAFKDAYWKINSLKVYQSDGSSSTPVVPGHAHHAHHAHNAHHAHHHQAGGAYVPATSSYAAPTPAYSQGYTPQYTSDYSPQYTSAYTSEYVSAWTTTPVPITTQNVETTFVVSTTPAASPTPITQWGSWSSPLVAAATPAPIPSVAAEAVSSTPAPSSTWSGTVAQASWFPDGGQNIPEDSFAVKPRNEVRRHARHILKHKREAGKIHL